MIGGFPSAELEDALWPCEEGFFFRCRLFLDEDAVSLFFSGSDFTAGAGETTATVSAAC
jgi:hypothetical protein